MRIWPLLALTLATPALAKDIREAVVCQGSGVVMRVIMQYTMITPEERGEMGTKEEGFGGARIDNKYLGTLGVDDKRYDIRYQANGKAMRLVINREKTYAFQGQAEQPKPTTTFDECHAE